jgi:hypothetical protein
MARRHQNLVARVDPVARERTADSARADDADLQRLLCRGVRRIESNERRVKGFVPTVDVRMIPPPRVKG